MRPIRTTDALVLPDAPPQNPDADRGPDDVDEPFEVSADAEVALEVSGDVDASDVVDAADDAEAPGDADVPLEIPEPPTRVPAPLDLTSLELDYAGGLGAARVRFEPEADDWLAVGWPSDRWRTADGHLDLSGFPSVLPLLDDYYAVAERALDGFGLNGTIYFELDRAIDVSRWPSPAATLAPSATLQLVLVSPGEHRGEHVPLEVRTFDHHDPMLAAHTLAIRPVYGFPLREGATYCALVGRGLGDGAGHSLAPATTLADALAYVADDALAPLRDWLPESPLGVVDLAAATCFTTQHATDELFAAAALIQDAPAPTVEAIAPVNGGRYRGTFLAPNFQAGDKPYNTGGGFVAGPDGAPLVQSQDRVRFNINVPSKPMPATGWPVIVFVDGTGADVDDCARMAFGDMLTLCFEAPLHGLRGPGGVEMDFNALVLAAFNYLNADAARASFRQAALDVVTVTTMLRDRRFDTGDLRLDPEHIVFWGISHGGITGTLALAVADRLDAGLIDGASGVVTETILARTDPVDIGASLALLLDIDRANLDRFHPLPTLIQMLVDATDPVNYAPHWLYSPRGAPPKHVMVVEAQDDFASPPAGTNAMAAAGGVPIVGEVLVPSRAHELLGLAPQAMPAIGNVQVPGGTRTAGLVQRPGDHGITGWDFDFAYTRNHFLRSALAGTTTAIRPDPTAP